MNFKTRIILSGALAFAACGDDDTPADMGTTPVDLGTPVDMGDAPDDMGTTPDMGMEIDMGMQPSLTTEAEIKAFLEGETLVMEGDDIPTHPNGFSEDLDLGASTQCYNQSTIDVMGGQFQTTSILGTLVNMMCDRTMAGGTAGPFVTTTLTLSNISGNADCFDVDAAYTGFGQEGRGRITTTGTVTVELELFFTGQALGHRCADGMVGTSSITLNGSEFMGDAVQVYRAQ